MVGSLNPLKKGLAITINDYLKKFKLKRLMSKLEFKIVNLLVYLFPSS